MRPDRPDVPVPGLALGAVTEQAAEKAGDLRPDVLEETHNVAPKALHFSFSLIKVKPLRSLAAAPWAALIQQYRPLLRVLHGKRTLSLGEI